MNNTKNAGVAKELRVEKTQSTKKMFFSCRSHSKINEYLYKKPHGTVRVLLGHVQHSTPDLNSTRILTGVAVGASVASSTFT